MNPSARPEINNGQNWLVTTLNVMVKLYLKSNDLA